MGEDGVVPDGESVGGVGEDGIVPDVGGVGEDGALFRAQ